MIGYVYNLKTINFNTSASQIKNQILTMHDISDLAKINNIISDSNIIPTINTLQNRTNVLFKLCGINDTISQYNSILPDGTLYLIMSPIPYNKILGEKIYNNLVAPFELLA